MMIVLKIIVDSIWNEGFREKSSRVFLGTSCIFSLTRALQLVKYSNNIKICRVKVEVSSATPLF